MLEANFFDELTKQVVFADHQFSITVSGLNEYNNLPGGDYAEDDVILYRLVPQKKGANVQFDMQMMNNGEQPAQPVNAGDRDEFPALFPESELLPRRRDGQGGCCRI